VLRGTVNVEGGGQEILELQMARFIFMKSACEVIGLTTSMS
jgi:hypothetical protein